MEKNQEFDVGKHSGAVKKAFLTMKLSLCFLILGLSGVYGNAFAQTKVNLSVRNATVQEVFKQLTATTDYRFVYSSDLLKGTAKVTCDFQDESIETVMSECLKGTNLWYRIEDNVVVISPNFQRPQPQVEEITITGKVTDENGQPLPGVAVVLKGTTVGVATDIDGNYTLQMPASKSIVLVFSFMGMKTQEIAYTGQEVLNVVMQEEVSELEDVVVTGYQTIVREKVTGSTSTITSRQLEERYTPNILDNLEGRVAGLVTYGDKTTIRGTSSLYAETNPLLVVDGLPIEGNIEDLNPYDIESITVLKDAAAAAIYGARASNGVIVVTTKQATKAGKTEIQFSGNLTIYEKKNMDYHDNFYMSPAEQVDVESAYYDYSFFRNRDSQDPIGDFENALGQYSPITPLQYAYYQYAKNEINEAELEGIKNDLKQNNFAKEFGEHALRRQFMQQYNLALRTRTEKLNTSLVFNLKRNNNGIINSYDNQINISYRASYEMKKWLMMGFSFNGIISKTKESASEYATDPFNVPAYYKLLNEDGSYNYYSPSNFNQYYTLDDEDSALKTMNFNHLEELGYDSKITDRRNMRYQGELLFKILEGLTINTSFVYETERQNVSNYSEADSYVMRFLRNLYTVRQGTDPNYTYEYMLPEQGGKLTTEDTRGEYWTWRGQLNFQRTFAEKHAVDFLGGFEFRETKYKGTKGILFGYDDQLQSQSTTGVSFTDLYNYVYTTYFASGFPAQQWGYDEYIEPFIGLVPEEWHRYASGYMNLTYTYDDRYNLFGSFRKDYADLFGANAKFRGKPLWSVGASWNMGNENFFSEVKWLNSLKLRLSYGKTGNIYQGATSYMTASTGEVNSITQMPVASIDSPANPNLKWEKTATTNVGIDFSVLDHRLRGSVDYYYKKGMDIFSQKSLDVAKGFTSMNMNMANMRNNGVEVSLSADWFRATEKGNFEWTTSFIASYNKNEITSMEMQATGAWEVIETGFKEGYPTSALFSYHYVGLDQVGAEITQEGLGQPLYATSDGRNVDHSEIMGADVNSVVYSGQSDPKTNVAMDNTLRYKGFSLNFMMVYYGGHKMRCQQYAPLYQMGYGPLADYYLDAWSPTNTDTDVPGIGEWAYLSSTSAVYESADNFVQSADFIKIRNITLGYEVPNELIRQIGLNNLRVTFQLDNIPALWKKNKLGVDPETLGIRNQMTYILGLNFNF